MQVVMLCPRIIKMLPWWVYVRKKSKAQSKVISGCGGSESGGCWIPIKQVWAKFCKRVPPPHSPKCSYSAAVTVRLSLLQGPSVLNRQAN